MLKTTSYILRQLGFATAFVTVVLTGAVWLTQSMRFVDVVINKGLPLSTFFYLVIFLLPDLVGIVLPAAFLIAVLFVYNRLTVDNELVVMRSIGSSHWQLAKPCMILACIVTCALYGITLYVLPQAFRNLKDLEHNIRNSISAAMLQEGEFTTFKGITIFIRARKGLNEMSGIVFYNCRDPKKPFTITAEHGSLIDTPQGVRLVLGNGMRQEIDERTGQPVLLYFDQHSIEINAAEFRSTPRPRKPYEFFITDLLNPDASIARPEQRPKFRARAFHQLLGPLHVLAFALIGVCIFLYGDFNRRGRSKRLMLGVGLCVGLQMATVGLINLSEENVLTIPLAYALMFAAIFGPLGYILELAPVTHTSWQRIESTR